MQCSYYQSEGQVKYEMNPEEDMKNWLRCTKKVIFNKRVQRNISIYVKEYSK